MSEFIDYELYDYTNDSNGKLVANGIKEYDLDDIVITEVKSKDGSIWWSKNLWLEQGCGISIRIFREIELMGFGLVGERDSSINKWAFSWEWFQQIEASHFYKSQEGGVVNIEVVKLDNRSEVSKVSFTTDISVHIYNTEEADSVGQRIFIKKGSVLKVATNQ
ncbi:MAG: hypothetical protein COA79_21075 [Planctomycetota bacterium]|nr:MAG: hypothetical protein COA79_21075 [Planctomycetota bacterium]